MFSNIVIVALAAATLVAGHGKPVSFIGNVGGNGTCMAIQGAVVADAGPNKKTELDTTVFGKPAANPMTDGMGKTTGQGKNNMAMIKSVMAQSGPVLPQVSAGDGSISGVFHVVTSDGCGPIMAVLDQSGTGKFSQGVMLSTTQDVMGTKGNCPKSITKKSYVRDLLERSGVITRRATNINQEFPVQFANIPADAKCTGTVGGVENVCLVKMANTNNAGPFGGVLPIQIVPQGTQPAAAPADAAAPAAAPAAKRAVQFAS